MSESITVTIPTLNSERTIGAAIESLFSQTRRPDEIIVVDNGSKDSTVDTVKRFGAKVLVNPKALLRSRCMAIEASSGDLILLMDSDQVLSPETLRRATDMMRDLDYLFLDEKALEPKGILENLYATDRRLAQDLETRHPGVMAGTVVPRFFRASVLKEAIKGIPPRIADSVIYRDHAIIAYEVAKLGGRAGWVPSAVYHHENSSLNSLLRKHYRYGRDDWLLAKSSRYGSLLQSARAGRIGVLTGRGMLSILVSCALMGLKLPPYFLGMSYQALFSGQAE
jgi:glycosyltransferase involved in cell wall biosynthesis